jgi:hypothetical protein
MCSTNLQYMLINIATYLSEEENEVSCRVRVMVFNATFNSI